MGPRNKARVGRDSKIAFVCNRGRHHSADGRDVWRELPVTGLSRGVLSRLLAGSTDGFPRYAAEIPGIRGAEGFLEMMPRWLCDGKFSNAEGA